MKIGGSMLPASNQTIEGGETKKSMGTPKITPKGESEDTQNQ